MRPKYLRYNIWVPDAEFTPTTAEWSETALPLPRPPLHELNNPIVSKTIRDNPHLFKNVTPINVDVFEGFLVNHPNPAFVKSVCTGLREGFWPWADTLQQGYPATHDENRAPPEDPAKLQFLRSQLATERSKDRFSDSFGKDLLPGMYCMPIHAVPKNETDFRLVTDQSVGDYSLNSMIHHDSITGYPLDNLHHFGEVLLHRKRTNPDVKLVLWKSDIAEAYRLIPMHPCWQIKQVNTIDGQRYIDWCNAFGGCASGSNFIAFNSLVAWIAKNIAGVDPLFTYVDDSSGCDEEGNLEFYPPYRRKLPRSQCRLLLLWDKLGIPHKEKKQLHGSLLPIIGIHVDSLNLVYTLSNDAKQLLIDELKEWSAPKNRFRLKQWQQLTGWMNWALNVFPHLRPALNNVYPKISGKHAPLTFIWVNNAIREDFKWAIDKLVNSSGVFLLKSVGWKTSDATITIYCDACPQGMGFWYPETHKGFYSPTPNDGCERFIFYFEALCVLSALYNANASAPYASRILIYTDNQNTVDIFNSLRCTPEYNPILKASIDITLAHEHDLRILHVPGVENGVADALSRCDFSRALDLVPELTIHTFSTFTWTSGPDERRIFTPPRETLGATLL